MWTCRRRTWGSMVPSFPRGYHSDFKENCLYWKKWANFAKCFFPSSRKVNSEGSKVIEYRIMYRIYISNIINKICIIRRWTVRAARQMCISSNCTRHGLCSAGSVQSVFSWWSFLEHYTLFHFNLRAGTVVFYHYFLPSYSVCYVFTSWPLTFTGLQRN